MRAILLAAAFALPAFPAFAQAGATIDLTGIATSVIAGIFAILGVVLPLLINARIKDAQAATVLAAAVKNSLGAIEQASTLATATLKPSVTILGLPPDRAAGLQYVLDHAGAEAARFGITPAAINDKIGAQIGLSHLASNIAAAIPDPLAPAPSPVRQGGIT